MSKFEIKIDTSSNIVKIAIAGNIDENANFSEFDMTGKSLIEIDLNKVHSINSLGARTWIKWLGTLSNYKVQFINCPKILIDQINMVSSMLPTNAKVISFYVPYINEDSGEEKYILFRHGHEFENEKVNLPSNIKDSNSQPMEIDVLTTRFFKFLSKNSNH